MLIFGIVLVFVAVAMAGILFIKSLDNARQLNRTKREPGPFRSTSFEHAMDRHFVLMKWYVGAGGLAAIGVLFIIGHFLVKYL